MGILCELVGKVEYLGPKNQARKINNIQKELPEAYA